MSARRLSVIRVMRRRPARSWTSREIAQFNAVFDYQMSHDYLTPANPLILAQKKAHEAKKHHL